MSPLFVCYNGHMAFPATYDFDYYIGDSKEFVIYPGARNGAPMDLSGYTAMMVISNEKAPNPAWSVDADVSLNATDNSIYCYIAPDVGNQLTAGTSYYYDVEIRRTLEGKEKVYTLVAGTIRPIMGVNKHV